jgi:excisionase family DNA binding protein
VKTYTTGQVARLVGVGRDTIYRWLHSKAIRASQTATLGTMKVMLWTERDVAAIREYMKQRPYKGRGRKKGKKLKV